MKPPRLKHRVLAAATLLILPALAQAHPGHAGDTGFAAGLLHPFTGIDHVLGLMVAGVLMGRLPERLRWFAFAGFLGMSGLGHAWWLEPALSGSNFVVGLVCMSAILIAAGMAATRMATRWSTAGARRSRT